MVDLNHTDRVFLRVDEVARYYEVSRRTVYNWVTSNKIPYVHVGGSLRFPVAALRRYGSVAHSVQSLPTHV